MSFTISQFSMVVRGWRLRQPGWWKGSLVSSTGALISFVVLIVIAVTRFMEGAWAVLLLIPLMVYVLMRIHKHYMDVAEQLSLSDARHPKAVQRHTTIVLISGVHRGVIPALQYGLSLAPDNVTAVYVDLDAAATEKLRKKWEQWGSGVPLVVLPSPYRSLVQPLLKYVDEIDAKYDDDVLSIIIPEFVPSKWWQYALHSQTALQLKAALFLNRRAYVVSVPYHVDH
jgi:hypothetical protein